MKNSIKNKRVLITCGPTWVAIDTVRVLSNISSGKLAQGVAKELSQQGAHVTLLEGPVETPLIHPKIKVIKFNYFHELRKKLDQCLKERFDTVIHAAAVSDYEPLKRHPTKLRSNNNKLTISFKRTPKLIEKIKRKRPNVCLIGFKLEDTLNKKEILQKTKDLFAKAHCDMVVVNTLKNKRYHALIIDKSKKVLAAADSRGTLTNKLISALSKIQHQI